MSYSPIPGSKWSLRLYYFIIVLIGAVCIPIVRAVPIDWYLKLPIAILVVHGFVSAGVALRTSYKKS